ncbi:MAG: FKBP-type peptidyl-prolyl cis-trans isomerase [Prevotellaceae bacterium]|nr:FKBP-type peptidyl-prolyl cis-trans isomerase [Prevotellaceae bacterium]
MATENKNKYIAVMYKLYTAAPGEEPELMEETAEGEPFIFVSALGMTLDAFEAQIVSLKAGDTFDFTLAPADAYGEYEASGKQAVPRSVFEINGKLDSRFIYEGAVVPLNSPDGARFNGLIVEIGEQTITVDINHPLAGKSLNFVGSVVEARDATNEEIRDALNQITGCGGCGGGCGGGSCGGGGCDNCSGCK